MTYDSRPSIVTVIFIAALFGAGFTIFEKFKDGDVPEPNAYRTGLISPAPGAEAPAEHAGLLSALIRPLRGDRDGDPAARDKLQTKAEFVGAFKKLLLSNISMKDAERCQQTVRNFDICGAWVATDNMLQSDTALAGKDIVGLVSPHYISCLRAKKQEMIDGFVEGSSSYRIQERNVLVAKAVCLSKAASIVIQEAHAK